MTLFMRLMVLLGLVLVLVGSAVQRSEGQGPGAVKETEEEIFPPFPLPLPPVYLDCNVFKDCKAYNSEQGCPSLSGIVVLCGPTFVITDGCANSAGGPYGKIYICIGDKGDGTVCIEGQLGCQKFVPDPVNPIDEPFAD